MIEAEPPLADQCGGDAVLDSFDERHSNPIYLFSVIMMTIYTGCELVQTLKTKLKILGQRSTKSLKLGRNYRQEEDE